MKAIARRLLRRRINRAGPDINAPIIGYARYLKGVPVGRALLSYLPNPVREELAGKQESEFSNRGIARALPRALNEVGYEVDIVSWDTKSFSASGPYDLLVQHGGVNYTSLRTLVKPSGKKIYFSTGSYWKYHNAAEKRRFDAFAKRHGTRPPYDRLVTNPEEEANREADGIIAIGNKLVAQTYKKFPKVLALNLACYADPRPAIVKNHAKTKNNFLFFAGGGSIHKGLDLTIEAFVGLDQHLYIMAYIEPEVMRVYEKMLDLPNIHYIGPGHFRSDEFYRVMGLCSFAILPSCSEGQPGSMVECLNEGLIPVISREVHLDIDDFGFLINRPSVNTVRRAVIEASKIDTKSVSRYSKAARRTALSRHSPERFQGALKNHLAEVLRDK